MGNLVKTAKANNIPDKKCFCLKCRIKDNVRKKIVTT